MRALVVFLVDWIGMFLVAALICNKMGWWAIPVIPFFMYGWITCWGHVWGAAYDADYAAEKKARAPKEAKA